ncbi:GntR family transcriptional regulator [Actinomadura sp. KC216]|uniref:GntR family transcriptional regulator n=1 Tax=Actinomadura sp. KC216 TaxID=2530370 RepID=UPI001405186B|nr:GntR family transcriptional regulator [Actinomadura sp. KC216]
MTINANDPRPAYLQVADDLRRRIQSGDDYRPGDRLPSIRALAKEYEIAPQTVQNALRELRYAGLVNSQQGRAFFVRDAGKEAGVAPDIGTLADRLADVERQLQELRNRVDSLEVRE